MSAAGDPFDGPDRERALADYARLAPAYDASCKRILSLREAAIASLRLRPSETVFDVACGTGAALPALAAAVAPSGRVIGIEQSYGSRRMPSTATRQPSWGFALNAFTLARAHSYFTSFRGLQEPWALLEGHCPGLRPSRHFHFGTSYLAVAAFRAHP